MLLQGQNNDKSHLCVNATSTISKDERKKTKLIIFWKQCGGALPNNM
jgi:hypothetical protein